MTNLPTNPKPNYQKKDEVIIDEKSSKIDNSKVIPALIKIIQTNRKLEKTLNVGLNVSSI